MTADLFHQIFAIEFPMTRRILERVPNDLPDWTPHPKSMPMGRLAMHIARLPDLITLCLCTPEYDAAKAPPLDLKFTSRENLLHIFDESVSKLRSALTATSDADLAQTWEFSFKGQVFSEESRAVTILHMGLGHLIHHRAQLGTYLRLNDLPLPPLYGPSADEPPQFKAK